MRGLCHVPRGYFWAGHVYDRYNVWRLGIFLRADGDSMGAADTHIPCDLGGGSVWQCAIDSKSRRGLSGTGKSAETSYILQLYGKFCIADIMYAEFVQRNI